MNVGECRNSKIINIKISMRLAKAELMVRDIEGLHACNCRSTYVGNGRAHIALMRVHATIR